MTFEAYLDGALWFRQRNWEPTAAGQQISDGRQINGDWCEIFARADTFAKNGTKWKASYYITVNIAPRARLDYSVASTDFRDNPGGDVSPDYTFTYGSAGIGPRTAELVRVAGTYKFDDNYFYDSTESYRLIVRLYFTRVTQRILRDPTQGNAILRAPGGFFGDEIQRDA